MSISSKVAQMENYVVTEIPKLSMDTGIMSLSRNSGIIYEAYLFTCVVEAIEKLRVLCPMANVKWELICPTAPQTLVLSKKACAIKPATSRYSYVRVWICGTEYELHTDVRVQGQSGVLSELDIVLLNAQTCKLLRRGPQVNPCHKDVSLFIEAKCYDPTLELGIGRGFLGLCKDEFGGRPIAYLASPASSRSISDMVAFHGKQRQKFWSRLDDSAGNREKFVLDVARLLCKDATARPKQRKKQSTSKQSDESTPIIQRSLFGC